jgi:hypothetical protein
MRLHKLILSVQFIFLLFVAPMPVYAQSLGLKTQAGTELGATLSHYRYEEPSLGVKLEGHKGGIDLAAVTAPKVDWFVRLESKYVYGKTGYTGSGTKNGNPDWYVELRGLFGRDFEFGSYVLAPFTGIGFRYLYNDIRGNTSTGAIGYTRSS